MFVMTEWPIFCKFAMIEFCGQTMARKSKSINCESIAAGK